MKIYTEEQLRNTIQAAKDIIDFYERNIANDKINEYVDSLTPIELPSDEEIEKEARLLKTVPNVLIIHSRLYVYWKEGAKWVIDKIKNQQQ